MGLRVRLGASPGGEKIDRLAQVLARQLAAADLMGRLHVLRWAHRKTGRVMPLASGAMSLGFAEDKQDADASLDALPDALMGARFAFDVGGADAASQIRKLTPVTREIFDGLSAQYRRDAFTLAGVADARLIGRIQESLAQTAEKGQTKSFFRKAAKALTTDAGAEEVNKFTLDTAFHTAMQKAYSAGRLLQMREPHMMEDLPFWQYWTMEDNRVRPEHAAIDQFIALAIDPVWQKIYPPSGYNCRCGVVPLPREEALAIDPNAEDGGLERLPAITAELVPTPGFNTLG